MKAASSDRIRVVSTTASSVLKPQFCLCDPTSNFMWRNSKKKRRGRSKNPEGLEKKKKKKKGLERKGVLIPRWWLNCVEWLPVNKKTSSIHPSSFFCSKCNLPFTVPGLYWTPVVCGCCFLSFFRSKPTIFSHKVELAQTKGWVGVGGQEMVGEWGGSAIADSEMASQHASSSQLSQQFCGNSHGHLALICVIVFCYKAAVLSLPG